MALKHLATFLLCWAFFFCSAEVFAQQKVTLRGKISNPKAQTVYIKRYDMGDFVVTDSARLNSSGDFSMSFHWSSPRAAIFQYGQERTTLFLSPGYKLSLTLDANAFDETLEHTGDGRAINSYFARKALFEKQTRKERTDAVKLKEADFIRFADSTLTVDKALLDIHFAGQKLSKAEAGFVEGLKTEMLYRWARERAVYPEMHTIQNQLPQPYQPSEGYYEYLKRIHLDNPAALASPTYLSFLRSFINAEVTRNRLANPGSATSERTPQLFEAINANFKPGKVKFSLVRETLDLYLRKEEDFAAAAKLMPAWLSCAKPWPALRTDIETLYNARVKLKPGNPAPDFTLTTAQGTTVSLSDFKGKVVFLDFWSSWCASCIMQMPNTKKVIEEFKNEDVVFLRVSFDSSEKARRAALEKHQVPGLNAWAKGDFSSEVAKRYSVKAMPQYILVGKDGQIIQNYSPPPAGMRAQIKAALAAGKDRQ